jgi:hypothetical protein
MAYRKYVRKTQILGESFSNANYRLSRDLLFHFAVVKSGHHCHRCGEPLTRETFSIEHIEDWMNHEDPVAMFFDLDNIAYSHIACNTQAAAYKNRKGPVVEGKRTRANRNRHRTRIYDPIARREKYKRLGT